MSYCLNPYCRKPQNPDSAKFCSTCGFKLLLGDRYRATKPIGRGGFGRTFLAIDEYKPSRPPCVIKQFFPQNVRNHEPERARELFLREAMRLEELGQHPQIPDLLAHFEQDDYQYLVQEFIDGPNLLQSVVRTGPWNEVQIWQLLNDLLPVITFIHEHQVIHRDIKPHNIIRRANTDHYVLVDFGAAKSVSGVDLATTGTSIGSPEFAAPEQAIGKATFASDLYSLGVTCVYLLTQVRPADLFDTDEGAWVWQQQVGRPVSPVLSRILDRMLQGPIKLRYQSAADVLRDLNDQAVMAALNLSADGYTPTAAPLRSPLPSTPTTQQTNSAAVPTATTQLPISTPAVPAPWRCTQTLTGHSSWVRTVIIHPNNQTLASGSGDRTIRIWDLATGALHRTLAAHTAWIRAIAVSPDGQRLASCSNDRTIKLWSWETGELLQTLDGHSDWVRSVCFSPDGRFLASSSQDKTIRIWRVATGEPIKTLTGHSHWVIALAFSSDGQRLVSGSRDKSVRIWNLQTGEAELILQGHQDSVNAVVLSNDDRILASASDDSTIRLWSFPSGELRQVLTQHEGAVTSLAMSDDQLVSGSQDSTIRVWTLDGHVRHVLTGHQNWVWSVAISPHPSTADAQNTPEYIVSGSWDTTVKIWQKTN